MTRQSARSSAEFARLGGGVDQQGQVGACGEFHCLVVEFEYTHYRMSENLASGAVEAHVVGGPSLPEFLALRLESSPIRAMRFLSCGLRPASMRSVAAMSSAASSSR